LRSSRINLFCDLVGPISSSRLQNIICGLRRTQVQNGTLDLSRIWAIYAVTLFFSAFEFLDELTHALLGCEMNSVFARHEEDENFKFSYLSLLDEGTELFRVFSFQTKVLVSTCLSFSLCLDVSALIFNPVLQTHSIPSLYFLCAFCSIFFFFVSSTSLHLFVLDVPLSFFFFLR